MDEDKPRRRKLPYGHQYFSVPKDLKGFLDASRAEPKTPRADGNGLRKRWKDTEGKIYEWDYQHGDVEVYDPSGRHLGEFDHETGDQIAPAEPNRRVRP